jgi:membrane-associated phospholipid phosphatase
VDRLVAGYLLLTAPVLLFPHRPDGGLVLLAVHVALAALFLSPVPARARTLAGAAGGRARTGGTGSMSAPRPGWLPRAAGFLADWYPLLLMPFLYWSIPLLSGSIWDGHYFDAVVMGWEESIFGGQPSATLARTWDHLLGSEILHGAYLAYYPVIYVPPAILYLLGRTDAFRKAVFALMLGFTAHYVVFVLFPVQGPRYLFPAPDGELASGALYRLTHAVLESGSSRGAAFPSTHAALAAVQTVNAIRYLPSAAPALALVTAGIALGAVYGGFHYGVDMIVGVGTGLTLGWLAPRVQRALS